MLASLALSVRIRDPWSLQASQLPSPGQPVSQNKDGCLHACVLMYLHTQVHVNVPLFVYLLIWVFNVDGCVRMCMSVQRVLAVSAETRPMLGTVWVLVEELPVLSTTKPSLQPARSIFNKRKASEEGWKGERVETSLSLAVPGHIAFP